MIGCKPLTDTEIVEISSRLHNRDLILFHLGLNTGFRISELLSIQISDLYDAKQLKNTLTISRANMKGKQRSRTVPLSNEVRLELTSYIQTLPNTQVYLFQSQKGNRLSRIQAWRAIKDAATKAGLQGKIGTHSMRKTVGTRAYQNSGKDIVLTQKILGHQSIQNTISYLQVGNEEVDELWSKIQK